MTSAPTPAATCARNFLCGRGRLGLLIAAALRETGIAHDFARLDAGLGLVDHGTPVRGAIDALVLCLVPTHVEGRSGWLGLLDGLLRQVQRGELDLRRVLFISSTSVYEGIAHGFVDAHTPVSAASVRSQGLLDAEAAIPQLAPDTAIFRLTGLVGPGYTTYEPLAYSHDKPRQAIDTRDVAREVAAWFMQTPRGHHVRVLTDGAVYWQGRKLDPVDHAGEIAGLTKRFRLLAPHTPERGR